MQVMRISVLFVTGGPVEAEPLESSLHLFMGMYSEDPQLDLASDNYVGFGREKYHTEALHEILAILRWRGQISLDRPGRWQDRPPEFSSEEGRCREMAMTTLRSLAKKNSVNGSAFEA